MGLLKHLLFWPVTGPSYLTRFSLEKVEGAVRSEVTDDASVKRALMELQMELELGDIDDEEYVEREAELMLQLREVRRWREQFGMATSGGLVKVAEGAAEAPDEAAPATPTPAAGESDESAGDRSSGSGREPASASDEGPMEEADRAGPSVARPDAAGVDIVHGFDED